MFHRYAHGTRSPGRIYAPSAVASDGLGVWMPLDLSEVVGLLEEFQRVGGWAVDVPWSFTSTDHGEPTTTSTWAYYETMLWQSLRCSRVGT